MKDYLIRLATMFATISGGILLVLSLIYLGISFADLEFIDLTMTESRWVIVRGMFFWILLCSVATAFIKESKRNDEI